MKRARTLIIALSLAAGLPAAFASEPSRLTVLPAHYVEVIALDSEQAEKLRQERERQREEKARLSEEHQRSIDSILSS